MAFCSALFSNVPKKFFTCCSLYENKEATRTERDMTFYQTLKAIALRSQATLAQDAAGAAALIVMLVVGLHLPGLV